MLGFFNKCCLDLNIFERKVASTDQKGILFHYHQHHICHGVGPLVDPFRSHVSRSLFKGLPYFLLPVGKQCFIALGNLLRGILITCCIQFLLYSSNLSRIGVIFNSFVICVFVLQSVRVYPAALLIYFISAAVILLASLALIVQVSLPHNKTGRASVLYHFILVFLTVFFVV